MIQLPALWRSGHDTNWAGGGGDGFSGALGASPRRRLREDLSYQGGIAATTPLRRASRFPDLTSNGYSRAKLYELDEVDLSPLPSPAFPFHSSSSITSSVVRSRIMGNKNSRVPVISYRSNEACPIQSKRLKPLRVTSGMVEKSTQTSSTRNVALDTSSLGKPAPLRGGSPGPGPGWYSPTSQPSSPAYTMSPRIRDAARSRSPGPGQHNLPEIRSGPAYTMGARFKSSSSRAHSPKPFAPDYRSSFAVVGKGGGTRKKTSWTNTALEGSSNTHANIPGHGVYSSFKPERKETKKEEKEKKEKKKRKKKEVGYFIARVNPKGPAYKITKTGAFLMPGEDDRDLSPDLSRPDTERRDSERRDSERREERRRSSVSPRRPSSPLRRDSSPGPGPGEYQRVEYRTSGPFITLKSRIRTPRSKEELPGPGAYDIVSRPGSPSYSLGARLSPPEDKASFPGPGAYRITVKPHGPHYSITGRPRESLPRSRSPGPGAYKYDNGTIGYGLPPFTLTGKSPSPRASDIPGPGSYPSRTPRSCSFTMLSRQSSPRTPDYPGPGSYSPQRRSSSPSFSIRGKLPEASGRDNPSPGSYSSRSSMDGPSFSIHGRLSSPASSSSRSSPGPGSYSIPSSPRSPSFTMYGLLKKKDENDVPGPGAYSPKRSRISPEFSIRGRLPDAPSTGPGPGTYNIDSRSSSPSFSIRGKLSRQESPRSPGPGAYFPKLGRVGPEFSIRGKLPVEQRSTRPGPGAYNVDSSPSFSIRGKLSCEERPRSPGPAAYQLPGTKRTVLIHL